MDRYIDHIGLHYEAGRTKAHWYHSNVLYGLLHQTGVNAAWKNLIGARFSHIPKDQQPRYGWDPKTTGRKQGFLENETAGNLQDLLEFFDPTKDDPNEIVRLAFEMAQLTPADQAPGRSSLDMPDKPPQPPPPPKREKSSKRSHSGTQKELAPLPPPPVKERPVTQWPGSIPAAGIRELPGPKPSNHSAEANVPMPDFDATAVPQPLFASTLSPPPQRTQFALAPGPSISITTASDPPPYATPTTPFPGLPRDTVVDLLNDYMSQDQLQASNTVDMPDMPPPFGQYDDWNSICSTMVDDVASPRGPPLPLVPHERPQLQQIRRSDVWAATGDHGESMYVDNVQACDITCGGLQDAPPLPIREDNMRRSDVWASSGPDYEGLDYEQEIAPPPPHVSWL
ncbi:hypothetical protein VMCG_01759 [Cytospora schulzeri]|uniref:Uncharacterized protein n=1 Tax=Cytospora schulzeri TaxID=448051 RepID=A0A423X2U5_9PEZI|nr:hypothetical protein VMCG_01759 [Valsa malicola]